MSAKNKNPLMGQQKKKRHLWGLWVPLIVIASIVILPVGFAAALLYDSSHVETGINPDETRQKDAAHLFDNVMVDMFDNCRKETNQTLDLTITQKQLNELLFLTTDKFSSQGAPASFLKQFSVQIEENSYIFDIEINAYNIAKSHITLYTEVQDGVELEPGVKGFLFTITNLKFGRLNNLQSSLSMLSGMMNLEDIFAGAGLKGIKADLANYKLTYTYEDFVNDLIEKSGTSNGLFKNIFSNFFKEGLVDFRHNVGENVTGTIEMEPFKENTYYTNNTSNYMRSRTSSDIPAANPPEEEEPLFNYISSIIEGMMDDGIISGENVTTKARAVMKFLAFGYDYVDGDVEEGFIDSIYDTQLKEQYCGGKAKIGEGSYSAYIKEKAFGDTSLSIMDLVTEQVNASLATEEQRNAYKDDVLNNHQAYIYGGDKEPLVIHDYEVQKMIKDNKSLIGYGFAFDGKKEDGKAKLAYTVLDNVYTTIKPVDPLDPDSKDEMTLVFDLNINGTETSLIMPMEATHVDDGNSHGYYFDIENAPMYFGEKEFAGLKEQIQEIIDGIQSEEGKMIQFIKDDENVHTIGIEMLFDFNKYFLEHESDSFTNFHNLVTSDPINARLVVEFNMVDSSDHPSEEFKRAGDFEVTVGYVVD